MQRLPIGCCAVVGMLVLALSRSALAYCERDPCRHPNPPPEILEATKDESSYEAGVADSLRAALDQRCCRGGVFCRCDESRPNHHPPAPSWRYNSEYLFAVSKVVRDECPIAAACIPLVPLALGADIATLPITAMFGLVGR